MVGFLFGNLPIPNSEPGETRTHGQWLKRPLLYQLSYGINTMPKFGGKVTAL